jgi:hypothetical protein
MECFRQAGVVGIVPVLGGVAATGLEDYRRDFRAFGLRLKTPIEPWELGVWTRQGVMLSRSAAAYLGVLKRFVEESASRSGGDGARSTWLRGERLWDERLPCPSVGIVPSGIFKGMAPVFDGGG